jgi:protein arginine kinase
MNLWDIAGPGNDVVISSRVRLARNIAGMPFPPAMTEEQGDDVAQRILCAVRKNADLTSYRFLQLRMMDEVSRAELVERHVASADLMRNPDIGAILLSADETVSLMINEEDHLRIQGLLPGNQIVEAASRALYAEAFIEKDVPLAFDKALGYLTSCPTNVGTGMRASMMLHLPALKLIGMLKILIDSVVKAGLAVRGIYGEGSEALGDMFQVSNQITLGVTEDDITGTIKAVCEQIVAKEHDARELLLANRRIETEDRLFRSWGLLKYARSVNSKEFMQLLSDTRLAVALGFITGLDQTDLNKLMIAVQPAALQRQEGRELATEEKDVTRANYIRGILDKKGKP